MCEMAPTSLGQPLDIARRIRNGTNTNKNPGTVFGVGVTVTFLLLLYAFGEYPSLSNAAFLLKGCVCVLSGQGPSQLLSRSYTGAKYEDGSSAHHNSSLWKCLAPGCVSRMFQHLRIPGHTALSHQVMWAEVFSRGPWQGLRSHFGPEHVTGPA